jgi:transposase
MEGAENKKWEFPVNVCPQDTILRTEGIPMTLIVLKVRYAVKERLRKSLRRCHATGTKLRLLIVLNTLNGRSARQTAEVLQVHSTTVYRVLGRFRAYGEAGLTDGRADNGADKLQEDFLERLDRVVRGTPQDYGWRRPTWTRELLVETLVRLTGVRIHVTTMSRALARIKARQGRPKQTVGCPWPKAKKTRRLNRLQHVLATLPRREQAFYEDEVDVHLNPKVGLDWMGCGQQKEVVTPGKNEKRYLAGALDVRSRLVIWVEGVRKTSYLFLDLLDRLVQQYPQARRLHLILDNYRIHSSEIVQAALGGYLAGKVQLHFLPPYCPDHNKIERVWQDLHANVTRNHRCASMAELMDEVRYYLRKRNRRLQRKGAAA